MSSTQAEREREQRARERAESEGEERGGRGEVRGVHSRVGKRREAGGGESVCDEVHPCRVNMIYSNSRVRGKGLLGCLYSS